MLLFAFSKEPPVIDTGTSTSRKVICMADVNVNNEELKALIGFHAMTDCDYVSSFFRKGKPAGKKWSKKEDLQAVISEEICNDLEAYVCALYGSKGVTIPWEHSGINCKWFQCLRRWKWETRWGRMWEWRWWWWNLKQRQTQNGNLLVQSQ